METAHSSGLASRLWASILPGLDMQHRVDEISKQFTGSGWKDLPRELVDEIMGHLLDDPDALRACSLTCKNLFGAARPLIHQRLCLVSGLKKGSIFSRLMRGHRAIERLIDADRSGLLRYTRHLTFGMKDGSFDPEKMQEYLPRLRSISGLHTLTLDTVDIHPFVPVFDEHFGMFTNTLRHLDIRNVSGTGRQLLYVICQFPLLEDLSIISPSESEVDLQPGHPVPLITQSPPLRGELVLAYSCSKRLLGGLAALPGGLNFRSLESFRCKHSQIALAACSHSVTSISHLWNPWNDDNSTLLDFERCVLLERFEFSLQLSSLSRVHGWVHQTVRTITSPLFEELVIWILNTDYPWSLRYPMNIDGWKAVDESLNLLAERNPGFRVVFKGDFYSFQYSNIGDDPDVDAIRSLIKSHLRLLSLKGLVKFKRVPQAENRFWRSGSVQ